MREALMPKLKVEKVIQTAPGTFKWCYSNGEFEVCKFTRPIGRNKAEREAIGHWWKQSSEYRAYKIERYGQNPLRPGERTGRF